MLKKLLDFAKKYKLFTSAIIGAAIALPLDFANQDTLAHLILVAVMLADVIPLAWGMIQDLRHGKYGVDLLAITAIITAALMHEYWAGAVIVLMLTGGESLEDYAEHRAKKELDALLTRAPQKARIIRGRKEIEVRISEVKIGDKVVIRPGETVPVDGIILEGTTSLDESSLTGESLPQVKQPDAQVLSGSINLDGEIIIKALHSAKDSQYEQIIKLVKSAAASQAPFVRLADRYAIPFTVISFGIAGTAWALSGQSIRFLEVLVVATPCPLILAAPIAIISGMSRAAKQGIIIKTGSALERLALAKTFGFDKTGTLTRGELKVTKVSTYSKFKKQEVLKLCASLAQSSNHITSKAIVAEAKLEKLALIKAKNVREIAGSGIVANISGRHVATGRLGLMQDYDVEIPADFDSKSIQSTATFVAIDNKLAAIITFEDQVRTEAKKTLASLKTLGVKHTLMVTGDNKTTAGIIAKLVGIKDFFAEALPADKIRAIEKVKERPVAFVGDGVNDAPVLTASDLGIALGARGSTAASESADVVIMMDDLHKVAESRSIAKRTFYIAKQSIWVGIAMSIALMLIFATGKFKPVYGAAIQELVDVVVIFNALRAHSSGRKTSAR